MLRLQTRLVSRRFVAAIMMDTSSSSSSSTTTTTPVGGPIQQLLVSRLQQALQPTHLEIENESHRHSVPKGSESHFKVLVVSSSFEGVSLVERHRLVNSAVKGTDTNLPVHALSISAKTPTQYSAGTVKLQSTPDCRGGSKADDTPPAGAKTQ